MPVRSIDRGLWNRFVMRIFVFLRCMQAEIHFVTNESLLLSGTSLYRVLARLFTNILFI